MSPHIHNLDPIVMCPRCHCCEMVLQECEACGGEGVSGHDCGEDCCCCKDPEENVRCEFCEGAGCWDRCSGDCDENGNHREAGK